MVQSLVTTKRRLIIIHSLDFISKSAANEDLSLCRTKEAVDATECVKDDWVGKSSQSLI